MYCHTKVPRLRRLLQLSFLVTTLVIVGLYVFDRVGTSHFVPQQVFPAKDELTIRNNMSICKNIHGKVMIFIAVEAKSLKSMYKMALDSIRCYVASTDYELAIVDVYNDPVVNEHCSNYVSIYFRKHCAASVYLERTDWLLVLDADTTVVNPNHCIEEYIDPRVNIIFYERFFNWEIAAGNYLAKNSTFTKNFLIRWANYEHYRNEIYWWKGFDNGALHMAIIELLLSSDSQEVQNCRNIWHRSSNYETYVPFVICVRFYLGANRIWPGSIKILRRMHGFCRDWFITNGLWTPKDFMLHGWKAQQVMENVTSFPFTKSINVTICERNLNGWPLRKESMVEISDVKHLIAVAEKKYSDRLPKRYIVIPYLDQPDIAHCYPDCDAADNL